MPRRIANATQAITQQVARWQCDALVVFEATGIYDLALREALRQAGIQFARINPARARDFARASGLLAKTDPIDARMLAAFARAMQPAPEQVADPARGALARLAKRRDQLVLMRARRRTGAARPTIAPWPNALAASSRSSTARSPRSRPTSAH
ncbi:transposase [Bradyrhizobium elkanii]|nr:transposase [Bradyrhizobium elkanii]